MDDCGEGNVFDLSTYTLRRGRTTQPGTIALPKSCRITWAGGNLWRLLAQLPTESRSN